MPRGRPVPELRLTAEERETLQRWARRPKTAQALALRARIVLALLRGQVYAVGVGTPGAGGGAGLLRRAMLQRAFGGGLRAQPLRVDGPGQAGASRCPSSGAGGRPADPIQPARMGNGSVTAASHPRPGAPGAADRRSPSAR